MPKPLDVFATVGIAGGHFQKITVASPANQKPTGAHFDLQSFGGR